MSKTEQTSAAQQGTTSGVMPPACCIPRHVAIIMDGNGRWAQQKGMDRSMGHSAGVDSVHRITQAASDAGIDYLTLYTFSTENWNRPQREVDLLMHLIVTALERETPGLIANNCRLCVIGDLSRVPLYTRQRLNGCMEATAHCTGLNLILAISYSARWELTRAMRAIAADVTAGRITEQDITDELISAHLTTAGIPDPDLLIRTGGEKRISNFLLWQIAYSEIYITDRFWPDFTVDDFHAALADYARRQRRFGKTGQQVAGESTPPSPPAADDGGDTSDAGTAPPV